MADQVITPSSSSSENLHHTHHCSLRCCYYSQIASLTNIAHHLITIKLSTPTNYPLWRSQFTLFLEAQHLVGFVDGSHLCPDPSTTNPDNHSQWVEQDRLIKSLLLASISEHVFPLIIGFKTSSDIWAALEKSLSSSSSSSSSSPSFSNNTPQIQKVMDTKLYKAVKEEKVEAIEEYNHQDQLLHQLTPNNNTVLHLISQFRISSPEKITSKILEKKSSRFMRSLLTRKNSDGETPLHIAARNGQHEVVAALIKQAKDVDDDDIESGGTGDKPDGGGVLREMMRMTNNQGDTALHEAVRHNNEEVVELLVKEEDPKFQHPSNHMDETPLYLAVEGHYDPHHIPISKTGGDKTPYPVHGIVDLILNTCISPTYHGPKRRTALHAAILRCCKECTEKVLRKIPALNTAADAFGWTPLHGAAIFDFKIGATLLLKHNELLALCTADTDENKTALHVAACRGSVQVMDEILEHRHDCWEMVTSKGQNILHLVVQENQTMSVGALGFILRQPWVRNLINQRDHQGNTPLHLFLKSRWLFAAPLLNLSQTGANFNVFNYQDRNLLDLSNFERHPEQESNEMDLIQKGAIAGLRNVMSQENGANIAHNSSTESNNVRTWGRDAVVDLKKASETHLLVAALIATVTFAAGFTLPGGYDDNSDGPNLGMAVLTKKAAFQVFVLSDTIALFTSLFAVTLHLLAWSSDRYNVNPLDSHIRALALIKVSLVAMIIAFGAGVYTVIASSMALAIALWVICGCVLIVHSTIAIETVVGNNYVWKYFWIKVYLLAIESYAWVLYQFG